MWTRQDIQRLYQAHAHMVFRRCRAVLGSDADARDVLQEVFVRILEHPAAFRGRSAESTWLFSVATNLCLQRLRGQSIRKDAWQEAVAERWSQLHPVEDPETVAQVRQLARRIFEEEDAETATMALLHFMDGIDQGEVARIVGRSRVTVNQKLQAFRARAAAATKEKDSHGTSD